MRRLCARLKKLEAGRQTSRWNWRHSDVRECARKKLSAAEAALADQAGELSRAGRRSEWTEAHQAAWLRWDSALAEATEEVNFPVYISADDTLL